MNTLYCADIIYFWIHKDNQMDIQNPLQQVRFSSMQIQNTK